MHFHVAGTNPPYPAPFKHTWWELTGGVLFLSKQIRVLYFNGYCASPFQLYQSLLSKSNVEV